MKVLTRRLQVLFPEQQYHALEQIVQVRKQFVGAPIREAIEAQYLKPPRGRRQNRDARVAKGPRKNNFVFYKGLSV